MFGSCCFGRKKSDALQWNIDLKPHFSGEFSMAVAQANSNLEDQTQVMTSPSATFVGVFDGHGGPDASRFVNTKLFPYLSKFSTEHGGLSSDVIRKAFNATEEEFYQLVTRMLPVKPKIASMGSCCLVGAISNGELYVANLGDSRAVLGRRGFDGEDLVVAERLSTDHNVSSQDVRREVEALHPDDSPVVVYCRGVWRIKGIIQVSRSIGDFYLKKPEIHRDPMYKQHGNYVPMKRALLSAEPSIITRKIIPQDLFVIFASDGLWEQLSDKTVVQLVSKYPRHGIAKRLVAAALHEAAKKREVSYKDIQKIEKGVRRHFHDDITVIVVYIDHQKATSNHTHRKPTSACFAAPMDIYSHNLEELPENPGKQVFPMNCVQA